MSHQIRLCNPFEFTYAIEYRGDRTIGFISEPVNGLLDYLERKNNITFIVRSQGDGIGEKHADNMFDGCVGLLQRNQSDVMLQMTNYPMDVAGIKQGHIALDTAVQFVSAYYPKSEDEVLPLQVDSCLASFSISVWLLCFLTAISALCLLKFKCFIHTKMRDLHLSFLLTSPNLIIWEDERARIRKNEKRIKRLIKSHNKYHLYRVVTYMARLGHFPTWKSLSKKVLITSLSIFALVVVHYFNTFIKTELVSVDKPIILDNYRQLLHLKGPLFFIGGFSTYTEFKFAAPGSLERKLWDKSVKMHSNHIFVTAQFNSIKYALLSTYQQNGVLVLDSLWTPALIKELCLTLCSSKLMRTVESFLEIQLPRTGSVFVKVSQDESTRPKQQQVIYSKYFAGPLYDHLTRELRRFYEVGLIINFRRMLSESNAVEKFILGKNVKRQPVGLAGECADGTIIMPQIKLDTISLSNLENLMTTTFILFVIAFLVLITEIFYHSSR